MTALGPVISRSLVTIHLQISFSCTLFSFVNFADIVSSAVLSWRIMTGEEWHQILRDTMVQEPYCSREAGDCGSRLAAIVWFISYYIIVTFIFINVFIGELWSHGCRSELNSFMNHHQLQLSCDLMWLSRDPPAVLLENFSIFYSKGETRLDHAIVKDFQQNWYYFDKGAHGSIPGSQIKLLLRMLRLQELYTYRTTDSGPRVRPPVWPLQ